MIFLEVFCKLIFIATAARKITVSVITFHADSFKAFNVYASVCQNSRFKCYCEVYLRSIRGKIILWEGGRKVFLELVTICEISAVQDTALDFIQLSTLVFRISDNL